MPSRAQLGLVWLSLPVEIEIHMSKFLRVLGPSPHVIFILALRGKISKGLSLPR